MPSFAGNFASIKGQFFDRKAITDGIDPAAKKALSRAGAFIRTRARSSIRKRKAASAPGQPPSSHEGSLKRLLFFSYDSGSRSVVIGPVPFREGTAPRLLEEGGVTTIVRKSRPRSAYYRPRPYMGPAFQAERGKIAEQFKDSIRGG